MSSKSRIVVGFVVALGILPFGDFAISSAEAALCAKCRDLMFVDSAGKCSDCGAPTNSGAMRYCAKCSDRLHVCEHCGAPLTAADITPQTSSAVVANEALVPAPLSSAPFIPAPFIPAPLTAVPPPTSFVPTSTDSAPAALPSTIAFVAQPLAPPPPTSQSLAVSRGAPQTLPASPAAAPGPINPQRPGTYIYGHWKYQLQISFAGTRDESRWGVLSYDDLKLPHAGVNDFYRTPWGPIYWVDIPQTQYGLHGWMPMPLAQNARPGRPLAIPAALLAPRSASQSTATPSVATVAAIRPQMLQLNRANNGQLAHVHVGNTIIVRLPGDPTTGYQWQAVALRNSNVPLANRPQYIASTQSGAPGTYIFAYQPTQPGAGSIRIQYVRVGDPSRPPAEVYAVNVDVQPTVR